jgi:TolB-like protein/class 3 adenylate cyclase
MERRLAAVMIADVAGYGRLTQADEEGTRARFQSDLQEVFEPQIAAHHGRLVKTMGDGLLVEFHSVVDALRCAVEVQRVEGERNTSLPAQRRMEFRIGINLGDVIVEGDDIHGDGVIIAERLQQLADTGGTVISGTAYDHVKGKVAVGFAPLGSLPVKNIAEPVRVYRVLMDPRDAGDKIGERIASAHPWRRPAAAAAAAAVLLLIAAGAAAWWRPWEPKIEPAAMERMALPLPDKPSIAVLPFANMSDDPKQEYFADGITDDLITELSKVSGLFVISRNSTFVYKGKTVPPKQVSEELGVRYVLEGSVQRAGDRLRINAQLIDAIDGGHEWADRFDGSLADVFALQDRVTSSVADALAIKLTAAERQSLSQTETTVPAAYEALLRGWLHVRRNTPEDYRKSIPFLEEAIKLDPGYGRAYAALAWVYLESYGRSWNPSLGVSDFQARENARRYLAEAEKHPTALYHQAAGLLMWIDGNLEKALARFKDAIALDSGDALSYAYLGGALTASGRPAEGIPHIHTAMRLDPRDPAVFTNYLGLAQFSLEQFQEAAASFETVTRLNPDDDHPFAALAATYGHLGRSADALSAVARFNALRVGRGGSPVTVKTMPFLGFFRPADVERLWQGWRLAGVPVSLRGSDFDKSNRMTDDEIRLLVIGHRLHGRSSFTGEERSASVSASGAAEISGDWVLGGGRLTGGFAEFEGGELCYRFGTVSYCGPVFRNPGGTKVLENEYLWDIGSPYTFSQVK